MPSIAVANPLVLLAAAAMGFAGVALDVWVARLVKPRRWLSYPAAQLVEGALAVACLAASALSVIALPTEPQERPSTVIAWSVGVLLSRALLDRKAWLGR